MYIPSQRSYNQYDVRSLDNEFTEESYIKSIPNISFYKKIT